MTEQELVDKYYPEHASEEEEPFCWCEPELIQMENGDLLIIHREEQ